MNIMVMVQLGKNYDSVPVNKQSKTGMNFLAESRPNSSNKISDK